MLRSIAAGLFILSFGLFGVSVSGQENQASRYSLNFGIGAEKIGLPFRRVLDFPVHSSYHLGIDRKWSDDNSRKSFQSFDINAFTNNSAGSGYLLQTSYGWKFNVTSTIFFCPSAGLGVVHLFRPKENYVLENGKYQQAADKGHISPVAFMNLKIGYKMNRIGFYGSYQIGAQYGYNENIDFLPRTFLVIGMLYVIRPKTKDLRPKTQDQRRKT